MKWLITVIEEENDQYNYYYDTWAEVLERLAKFDGLAVEYSITRVRVTQRRHQDNVK